LFIYSSHEGVPLFHSAKLRAPALFATCLFCSAAYLLFSFFSFSLGEGQSIQGAMLICPREYHIPLICSPGGLPSSLGAGDWWCGSPPGFSI
jgi:hypothetical protein